MTKKIIYIDLDNTLANYAKLANELGVDFGEAKQIPGFFSNLEPMDNAIEAFNLLSEYFDVYILSTSPWSNPYAAAEKFIWVKKYLGDAAYKRLILSHHKHLNHGDYLIDDMGKNGTDKFTGEWIKFGSDLFLNWNAVVKFIFNKENIKPNKDCGFEV